MTELAARPDMRYHVSLLAPGSSSWIVFDQQEVRIVSHHRELENARAARIELVRAEIARTEMPS